MTSKANGGSEKDASMPPFPKRGTRAKLSRGEWVFVVAAILYGLLAAWSWVADVWYRR